MDKMESYDDVAVLCVIKGKPRNDNGFKQNQFAPEQEERTEVFVHHCSVSRSEFYQAAKDGHTVEEVLSLQKEEYESSFLEEDGQKMQPEYAEYEGKRYRILRTYEEQDRVEIVLEAT